MLLRLKKILFLLGLFINLSVNSYATTQDDISYRTNAFMKKHHIHGAAVLIAKNGEIKTYLFGEAVPSKHIPVTENTIFELGSITKTFTGILLAQSLQSSQTKFDEKIEQAFTPHISQKLQKITYLDLATYTSGLPFNPDGLPYNASDSSKNQIKLRNYLKNASLSFQPSSHMFYSNFGFGILGNLLAKKEKFSLSDLMRQNILSPLNMHASDLNVSNENKKYLAQGYTKNGKPVLYHPAGLFAGSWAMRSSVNDMRYYLKAALAEPTTPKKILQAMQLSQSAFYTMSDPAMTDEGTQIGLGWFITPLNQANAIQKLIHQPDHYPFIAYKVKKIKNPSFNSNAVIAKTGATDGFRAYIAVIPEKNTGIVIMINRFIASSGALSNFANELLLQESDIKLEI